MPTEKVTQLAERYVLEQKCKGYFQVLRELTKGVSPKDRSLLYTQLGFEVSKILREIHGKNIK